MKTIAFVDEVGSLEYILENLNITEVFVPTDKIELFRGRYNLNFSILERNRTSEFFDCQKLIGLTPTITDFCAFLGGNAKFFIDTSLSLDARLNSPILSSIHPLEIFYPGIPSDISKKFRKTFNFIFRKRTFTQNFIERKQISEASLFGGSIGRKRAVFLAEHYYGNLIEELDYVFQERAILHAAEICKDKDYDLFFKKHPSDLYEYKLPKNVVQVENIHNLNDILPYFECVIGIDSVALIQASKMGLHTISLQPNKQKKYAHLNLVDNCKIETRSVLN